MQYFCMFFWSAKSVSQIAEIFIICAQIIHIYRRWLSNIIKYRSLQVNRERVHQNGETVEQNMGRIISQGATISLSTKFKRRLRNDWQIYVFLLPALLYLFLFNYIPIYGIQIAFKNFSGVKGIFGSPWVGLEHFRNFFQSYYWKRLLLNTL
jgi:hypothetical protein